MKCRRVFRIVCFLNASRSASTNKPHFTHQTDAQTEAKSRIACYPHRILTRPVLPLDSRQINTPLFTSKLLNLTQTAKELSCISFSAPKAHWDASVVVLRPSPDAEEFDVWVNPQVPGYDDPSNLNQMKAGLAPMYGMWENCISCGSCYAWVIRPQKVACHGYDQFGNEKHEVLEGLSARCLMHELDHLNGKTIIHQAQGPEFVVSSTALGQRDLWPTNFPSAEAYVTAPNQFFDYVKNTTVVPGGLEWWFAQNMSEFNTERLSI